MLQEFDASSGAYLNRDPRGIVRELLHFEMPFFASTQLPQLAAREYLEAFGQHYAITTEQLKNLGAEPSGDLSEEGVEYRFLEEKTAFDTTTVGYQQTYFGLPVWQAGLSIHMKRAPNRVLSSQFTAHETINAKKPTRAALRRFAKVSSDELASLLGVKAKNEKELPRVQRHRLVILRYEGGRRFTDERTTSDLKKNEQAHAHPQLPLPPVPDAIVEGQHYVAAEIIFEYPLTTGRWVTWVALAEVETGAVLYLRAFIGNVNGMVFVADPITSGSTATPASNATTLNPLRSTVALPGLTAPPAGSNQSLTGNFIQISDFELATAAPPTVAPGGSFNYGSRTNNFAAVNAYYHTDRFFRLVQNLGFNISTYFNGTTFPLPVDHRGRFGSADGIERNASCSGNGSGGIANVDFELADLGDTANPIGIAADWRVALHELGGHGILYDHVNSANFGFAHSAGDSFAAILNDPDTQATDRFQTFPWVSFIGRRHDRSATGGWAWGGTQDSGGYNSEQILCTTHFRIYRSIGGDSGNVNMRRFAADYMAYLMLRAVGTLSPATNPSNVSGYATALLTADQFDWTSKGHAGGAYGKVIRWSFEKQGLYQPAGAPTPVASEGAPPAVDVYIEDGRNGQYQYLANHWNCQAIWNRRNNDGGTTHEEPIVGVTNYAYVKIKNRGTQTATNVVVKGYHCKPATGLIWPNDWQPMTTAQLSAPNVAPNSSAEITVGPFAWIPSQPDHECMLMIVSSTGDPSNVSNFTAGDSIPEWRLVPNDNNIGQRNVAPVPGGGGIRGLLLALAERRFWVNNPHLERARLELAPTLPAFLVERGWQVTFLNAGGGSFSLEPGQSKEVIMSLLPGKDFTAEEIMALREEDRVLHVETLADGIVVGGMSYAIDPAMKAPLPQKPPKGTGRECATDVAEDLLDCLKLPSDNVKSVRVRRITVDIEFKEDCD